MAERSPLVQGHLDDRVPRCGEACVDARVSLSRRTKHSGISFLPCKGVGDQIGEFWCSISPHIPPRGRWWYAAEPATPILATLFASQAMTYAPLLIGRPRASPTACRRANKLRLRSLAGTGACRRALRSNARREAEYSPLRLQPVVNRRIHSPLTQAASTWTRCFCGQRRGDAAAGNRETTRCAARCRRGRDVRGWGVVLWSVYYLVVQNIDI